jgi:hypothetical protein
VALATVLQVMLSDYVSFILLLFALYTVAGGILIGGSIRTSPWTNVGIVALGTVMASFVGTTGASLILVRPLIRANEGRRHNVHVVIFFISGRQYRRRADAAGRSAAVCRLSARGRFLVACAKFVAADRDRLDAGAGDFRDRRSVAVPL